MIKKDMIKSKTKLKKRNKLIIQSDTQSEI